MIMNSIIINKNKGEIEQYIKFKRELICSLAYTTMSINEHRLLTFLMQEHFRKGGQQNGDLIAPYNQLNKFGIPRRYINKAIYGLEQRGLIIVDRGARTGGKNYNNRYAITFAYKKDYKYPQHWKRFAEKDLEKLKSNRMLQKQNKLMPESDIS